MHQSTLLLDSRNGVWLFPNGLTLKCWKLIAEGIWSCVCKFFWLPKCVSRMICPHCRADPVMQFVLLWPSRTCHSTEDESTSFLETSVTICCPLPPPQLWLLLLDKTYSPPVLTWVSLIADPQLTWVALIVPFLVKPGLMVLRVWWGCMESHSR